MKNARENALPNSVRDFFKGEGEEKSSAQSPGTESAEAATQVFAESMETMAQALARRIANELLEVAMKGFIALTTPGVGDKAAAQAMVTALTKRYGDLSE